MPLLPLILGAGFLGVGGFVLFKNLSKPSSPSSPPAPSVPAIPMSNTPTQATGSTNAAGQYTNISLVEIDPNRLLQRGSREGAERQEIKKLQMILGVSQDGVFGAQTEQALTNLANRGVSSFYKIANPNYKLETRLGDLWAYDIPAATRIAADKKYPNSLGTTTTNTNSYASLPNVGNFNGYPQPRF